MVFLIVESTVHWNSNYTHYYTTIIQFIWNLFFASFYFNETSTSGEKANQQACGYFPELNCCSAVRNNRYIHFTVLGNWNSCIHQYTWTRVGYVEGFIGHNQRWTVSSWRSAHILGMKTEGFRWKPTYSSLKDNTWHVWKCQEKPKNYDKCTLQIWFNI